MNEWMNHGGVCRTAPATPGLLKIRRTYEDKDIMERDHTIQSTCWFDVTFPFTLQNQMLKYKIC